MKDLINLQVEQYKRGIESKTNQTEAVVILGPNDVLPPLSSDAFQNTLDLLKELKKGHHDMKVQVKELKKKTAGDEKPGAGFNSGSCCT